MAPAAPDTRTSASKAPAGPRADAGSGDDAGLRPAPTAHEIAPLGFAQIAFAGHNRPEDLGNEAQISAGLAAAWAMLTDAGVGQARLLSGFSEGADVIAVETWQIAGLGAVQIVLPFLDQTTADLPEGLSTTATRLDGAAVRANLRSPHLAQSRWLVGAADLLVVVWNGQAPRGSGGTADTVRLALEHGVPVLWIRPGEDGGLRLLRPEFLFEGCGFLELIDQLQSDKAPLVTKATPSAIHAALLDLGLGQVEAESLRPEDVSRPRLAWPWRAYALFRRTLGGRQHAPPEAATPPDLASQPGFLLLTAARDVAAREAQRLGAVHRSKQVILLAIAITMATAGSAPALWPSAKLPLVTFELILALLAFFVWIGSERGAHHLRWGSARKRAEDLRLERAAWVIGVSTVPHDPISTNTSVARHARRLAALPQGAFDEARVESWGAWVVNELLSRQAAYHRDQAVINGKISHRVHQAENVSFAALLGLLGLYIVVAVGFGMSGGHAPKWLAGLAVMGGAIVPAIGAAGLALEATLSLDAQAHRSQVLRRQLEALRTDLGPGWRLEDLQGVTRTAIKLQRAQEDHWSDDAGRRRLFRGG